MHTFLIDNRDKRERKPADHGKIDRHKAPEKKKPSKLFPKSVLFKTWGANLSEDDQREAEVLFWKYGYNVFLSDRLPLDRPLPDTRDPRYVLRHHPH